MLLTNSHLWQIDVGLMVGNSQVIFEKAENSSLTLVGTFCPVVCS